MTAFACNAKSFAITIIFYFFCLSTANLDNLAKFLSIFSLLFLLARMTSIELIYMG